jgi:hypothetical protein
LPPSQTLPPTITPASTTSITATTITATTTGTSITSTTNSASCEPDIPTVQSEGEDEDYTQRKSFNEFLLLQSEQGRNFGINQCSMSSLISRDLLGIS